MRDEELALRSEEVTGELPPDLEFEEFNAIREQLTAMIEQALLVYQQQQIPLNLGKLCVITSRNIRVLVILTWLVSWSTRLFASVWPKPISQGCQPNG